MPHIDPSLGEIVTESTDALLLLLSKTLDKLEEIRLILDEKKPKGTT